MTRILLAVAGEGFGHSSRAELVCQRLLGAGHDVLIAASRRSLDYLSPIFPGRVEQVFGLSFAQKHGKILHVRTAWQNIAGYPAGFKLNRTLWKRLESFRPQLVLSDFEPFAAAWARRNQIPCIAIDNEHLLIMCRLDDVQIRRKDRWLAKIVTRGYRISAQACIIPYFFNIPVVHPKARLAPPLVRKAVLEVTVEEKPHITVYSTYPDDGIRQRLIETFGLFGQQEFCIYGFADAGKQGNCVFKKISTGGFLNDLAKGRGVIANAGLSLISECLYCKKRMLLVPVESHFEQTLNAHYVQRLGLGLSAKQLNKQILSAFLDSLETPCPQSPDVLRPDNDRFFQILDQTAAGLGLPLGLD
jgi:uncharacterized protein (TIGR00661 family)